MLTLEEKKLRRREGAFVKLKMNIADVLCLPKLSVNGDKKLMKFINF